MDTKPLISVIIPVDKTTPNLKKCLDSLVFQTYDNIEILCVTQSEENVSAIFKDSKIHFYEQPNKEIGKILNYGLEKARGKYVSFINPNDWVLLDLYNVFQEELEQHKNIDIFMFNGSLFFDNKIDIPSYNFFEKEDFAKENSICTAKDIHNILLKNVYLENKIYNKSFLKNNKQIFLEKNVFCKQIFNIQALLNAKNIVIMPKVYYRKRPLDNEIITDEQVFDVFETTNIVEEFLYNKNLIKYYKTEFFIFICSLFQCYYSLCPQNLKQNYYKQAKIIATRHYDNLPNEEISKISNLNIVKAFLDNNI